MLTFLLPLLFVGALVLLEWQLGRPAKHLPPAFYRPVESAKDVDPEAVEAIRRRNEAQLAKTRETAGPNPAVDRHVAFPFDAAVEHAQKAIASAAGVPAGMRRCADTGHMVSVRSGRCSVCGGQVYD